MKLRNLFVVMLAMLMVGMASTASAHGPRVRFGVHFGGPVWGPVWGPGWYPAPYYYPPQVIVVPPPQPQIYIEQQQDAAPDSGQQYWSSSRKRSMLCPVPGRTMTLGPVGSTVQAPSNSAPASTVNRGKRVFLSGMIHFSGCGRIFCQPPGHSLT